MSITQVTAAILCLKWISRNRSSKNEEGNQSSWNVKERREKLEEDATKAGYDNVGEYMLYLNKKKPAHLKVSAHQYQECVAEYGAENTRCKMYKEYWLECKAAQNA